MPTCGLFPRLPWWEERTEGNKKGQVGEGLGEGRRRTCLLVSRLYMYEVKCNVVNNPSSMPDRGPISSVVVSVCSITYMYIAHVHVVLQIMCRHMYHRE